MTTPDPVQQAIAIAKIDTKVDTLFKILGEHKRDLEDLKARRMPWGFAAAGFSCVAAVATVYSVVHK